MTNDKLLSKLLKSKNRAKKDKKGVIDEFISEALKLQEEALNESLSSLLIFITQNLDNPMLKQLTEAKIEALNLFAMPRNIEETYQAMAKAGISFDRIDIDSIKAMQNNFHWLKEDHSIQTQEKLKSITTEVFHGRIPRDKMGATLKEAFKGLKNEELQYFEGVSDHIISQSQNIATINQARKYNAPYYKVMAIMDNKTSPICRSMHGRILKASMVEEQSNNIINAKSMSEKKKASVWHTIPYNGDSDELSINSCLPPYHFRCRTEIVPVWVDEYEVNGVKMRATQAPSKDEAIRHIDRSGVERILTKRNYKEGKHTVRLKDKAPLHRMISALNSIKSAAPSNKHERRVIALCNNNYVLVFEGVEIVTAVLPEGGKKGALGYFKRNTIREREEIIKWQSETLLSAFFQRIGVWQWLVTTIKNMMAKKSFYPKK